jgi:hypothetical protein
MPGESSDVIFITFCSSNRGVWICPFEASFLKLSARKAVIQLTPCGHDRLGSGASDRTRWADGCSVLPPIEYRIATAPHGVGYEIVDERLTRQPDDKPQPFKHIEEYRNKVRHCEPEAAKLVQPNWGYDPTESDLSHN